MSTRKPKTNQKALLTEAGSLGAFTATETKPQPKQENQTMFDNDDSNSKTGEIFTPDFSDMHEEVIIAAGLEKVVQIRGGEMRTDKKGNPFFLFNMSIPDEPYAKDFSFFLFLPGKADDAKTANRKNLRINAFMQAFQVERSINPADLVGRQAWAILGVQESDEFGEQNTIKRWVGPA